MTYAEWSSIYASMLDVGHAITHARNVLDVLDSTREIALTRTKLQEADMWLEAAFKTHWDIRYEGIEGDINATCKATKR